jgi:hypothetical protein
VSAQAWSRDQSRRGTGNQPMQVLHGNVRRLGLELREVWRRGRYEAEVMALPDRHKLQLDHQYNHLCCALHRSRRSKLEYSSSHRMNSEIIVNLQERCEARAIACIVCAGWMRAHRQMPLQVTNLLQCELGRRGRVASLQ